MVQKMERRLVHIEDPSHVAMWTDEERTDLLEERRHLIAYLVGGGCASLVAWRYT